MDTRKYIQAKEELLGSCENGCQQFFLENNCFLELGYFYLLHEDTKNASLCFEKISEFDPRAKWANFLSKLVTGKIDGYPTYFELRNFFEIDLDLLLKYYLGDYVENVIQYSDWLSNINLEVQKYTGRVFFKNGYDDYGYFYLQKARDTFYNDPELHYLFAEYFYSKKNIINAELSLQNCLEILPKYYPAIQMLKKINSEKI